MIKEYCKYEFYIKNWFSIFFIYLFIYLFTYFGIYKNADLTYYQKYKDLMLNKAKDLYENNKERLREQARGKYRSLSEEKKIKKENTGRIGIIICLKKKNKD